MLQSTDRVLTTHVGSLPRPQAVVDMLFAQDRNEPYDQAQFDAVMTEYVLDAARKQVAAGIDIISDGEMSKISYATYIRHRLTGFEMGEVPRAVPKDLDDYPGYRDKIAGEGQTPKYKRPICKGEITVKDLSALEADIRNLVAARDAVGAREAFMNAASPGVIGVFQPNEYYATDEEYLYALADAMKIEYKAIVDAGLLLQIDCPDLAMSRHIKFRDDSDDVFLQSAERQVEALNYALRDLPADRLRMHVCWGNYAGPHVYDIGLTRIFDLIFKAKPQAILFEASNPRHAHEWTLWKEAQERGQIPPDKILVPGVLDSTTNFVEHPGLVAERLRHFIDMVGQERVIAGTDCGFGTFAGFGAVYPDIAYAKFAAMAEGAQLASDKVAT